MNIDDKIAMVAAKNIPPRSVVNLGFGLPILVAKYAKDVTLYGENGIIGYGTDDGTKDVCLTDGGTNWASRKNGMCFIDSATSFAIARGGHLDVSILGAIQVSENGDLASWSFGNGVGGIGGAADMSYGAKKLIAVMKHTDKNGHPKIVKKCIYPLTAIKCVNLIVTDMAVIEVNDELCVIELCNGYTFDDIQKKTGVVLRNLTSRK